MNTRNIEDIYPLSPMQQGMLFHSLYAPDSGVYVEQMRCTLRGNLNIPAFERAWQQVVNRHPILRTAFMWEELDEPLQVVYRSIELSLGQQDWRDMPDAEAATHLETFLQTDRQQGFDPAKAPLIRLTLIRTAEDTCWFVPTHHHLLLDGWSFPILFQEVLTLYEAVNQGREISLPPARPYRDYIAWLQTQSMEKAEQYWRQTLEGFSAPTPLVVERPRQNITDPDEHYAEQEIWLPKETTTALQTLARQHQLTPNILVQGALALLLSRYSGENDIVFGATVSGRPPDLSGIESMIGLFINTLPVRVQVNPEASITAWLQTLQAQQVELQQYEYSALVQVQKWSDVPRDQPLFHCILVFENYPVSDSLQAANRLSDLQIDDIDSMEQTNYPLTVVAGVSRQLMLKIAYDGRRFAADTIERMLTHLQTLLEGIAADPEQHLSTLPMLTEPERQQQLVAWNDTQTNIPADQCVHHLFEAQAVHTPDATAIVFEEQQLTYAEVNHRANQLAHHLQKQGVGPETLVAICTDRSPEMIVAVLGALKAGGAFLPLDPHNPAERLAFTLADSQAAILLTQDHLIEQLPQHPARVIRLDADWNTIAQEAIQNPTSPTRPENLAYVIYTSGSTGRPKGTLLHHQGLVNFATAFGQLMRVDPHSRLLQFASFSFDASVAEIFIALLAGAALHLARRETLLSLPDLTNLLQQSAITTAVLPPAILRALSPDDVPGLRTVVSAGEACSPEIVERWAAERRFINGYGPTETSVGASSYLVESAAVLSTHIPIGQPIANR